MKEERCSFCGKTRTEVRVLVKGMHAYICDGCVAWAGRSDAPAAYCSTCLTTDEGKHAIDCPELGILS